VSVTYTWPDGQIWEYRRAADGDVECRLAGAPESAWSLTPEDMLLALARTAPEVIVAARSRHLRSCGWCHAMADVTPWVKSGQAVYCPDCGHNAVLPRGDCDCPACARRKEWS
jgi:hypothetical protein